jgi:uncharacterized membrane-anchored protein YhcB (DUF1043 family)
VIQWALGATVVAVLLVAVVIKLARSKREKVAELEADLQETRRILRQTRDELERHAVVAEKQGEIREDANQKKRGIRNSPDPGDRARAATDVMSELAGSGDRDPDGAATGN